MGLDIVELIMEVEETFGTPIPDAAAQKMFTVGDLVEYVRSSIRGRISAVCMTSRTFYRFRSELMQVLPLTRAQIHPSGQLAVLVPARERRRVWEHMHSQGLALPRLRLSSSVFWLSVVLVLATAWAVAWTFKNGFLLGLVFPFALVTWLITLPLATEIRRRGTVREAIYHLVPRSTRISEPAAKFSDEEIAQKIRWIVSDNLGVPVERVTEQTRFVEDLGAD